MAPYGRHFDNRRRQEHQRPTYNSIFIGGREDVGLAFLSDIFDTSDEDEKRDEGDGNDSEDGDNEGDGTSGLNTLLED